MLVSRGTPSPNAESGLPSASQIRRAPCLASSLTPASMSASKSVLGTRFSTRARVRSARSIKLRPQRSGMQSSSARNSRSPVE